MEVGVALDLNGGEEHAAVEEEEVALPPARVVVRLGVECSWHGPDSSSSHFLILLL